MIEKPFTLLAIVSAIPGAYLVFVRSFFADIRDQMVDTKNPGGVGTRTVGCLYGLLAFVYIGRKDKWLELFNPTSEEFVKAFRSDKASGVRIFVWFLLVFVFSFLAWLNDA